jgi:hypothetical protein
MKKAPDLKKTSLKRILVLIFLIVIIVIAVVAGIYFYQYQKNQSLLKNPQKAKLNEVSDLVEKVGKLIKLPNEAPQVATVSDVTKLRDQSIFKNAQNGDKVLIFSQTKRAIVYRPSENVIIEVGNLVLLPKSNSPTSQVSPTTSIVRVSVYNGTVLKGLAKEEAVKLKSKYPNIDIIDTKNAVNEYQKTLIIDVSGKNKDLVSSIATELEGETGVLPQGEEKPSSDVLVILGK